MSKKKGRSAPPAHFQQLLFGSPSSIELLVTVSDISDIKQYGFAYDGASVPMSRGKGTFYAQPSVTKLLEWGMRGEPGGTMKVVVTNGDTTVAKRDKSMIVPPEDSGYDAFQITVS
ncbi:MAG: hypothetical protein ACJ8FS_07525 [Sphingomicrobium sp.]